MKRKRSRHVVIEQLFERSGRRRRAQIPVFTDTGITNCTNCEDGGEEYGSNKDCFELQGEWIKKLFLSSQSDYLAFLCGDLIRESLVYKVRKSLKEMNESGLLDGDMIYVGECPCFEAKYCRNAYYFKQTSCLLDDIFVLTSTTTQSTRRGTYITEAQKSASTSPTLTSTQEGQDYFSSTREISANSTMHFTLDTTETKADEPTKTPYKTEQSSDKKCVQFVTPFSEAASTRTDQSPTITAGLSYSTTADRKPSDVAAYIDHTVTPSTLPTASAKLETTETTPNLVTLTKPSSMMNISRQSTKPELGTTADLTSQVTPSFGATIPDNSSDKTAKTSKNKGTFTTSDSQTVFKQSTLDFAGLQSTGSKTLPARSGLKEKPLPSITST
ncbi:unnamed protein product, partial [Cylicostephanus goldi]